MEDTEEGMARLQSKFLNFNAKVNQILTTDIIPKPELLFNPANKANAKTEMQRLTTCNLVKKPLCKYKQYVFQLSNGVIKQNRGKHVY